jgi:hypothetical protein
MKNYFLFIFAALILFVAPQFASAANYFVGVTIASGQAPGYPSGVTNTNWCLPAISPYTSSWGTQFYIRSGTSALTPISPTANPISLAGPACAGDTVWSGLFNLTSGVTYNAYFNAQSYAYCPGVMDYWTNGSYNYDVACWTAWDTPGQNKSCADVCSHYGSQVNAYTSNYPRLGQEAASNCRMVAKLMGGTCSSCTTNGTYDYYNPTTFACTTTTSTHNTADANGSATLGSDLVRVCACNVLNSTAASFSFNFTPTF